MTRQEYLAELNTHLMSLPSEERENAVRFYEEYFEDAGAENEQSVMDDLGKPFALAKSIICEQSAYSKSMSYAKYRESKSIATSSPFVSGEPTDTAEDIMPQAANSTEQQPHTQYTAYNYSYSNNTESTPEPQQSTTSSNMNTNINTNGTPYDTSYESYKESYTGPNPTSQETYTNTSKTTTRSDSDIIILILGIIFGVIFLIPILFAIIAVLFGLGIAAIALVVVAVIALITGAAALITSFGTGMLFIGIGLLLAGIGLIIAIPTILGFFKFVPWSIKMIIKFFKRYAGGVA